MNRLVPLLLAVLLEIVVLILRQFSADKST